MLAASDETQIRTEHRCQQHLIKCTLVHCTDNGIWWNIGPYTALMPTEFDELNFRKEHRYWQHLIKYKPVYMPAAWWNTGPYTAPMPRESDVIYVRAEHRCQQHLIKYTSVQRTDAGRIMKNRSVHCTDARSIWWNVSTLQRCLQYLMNYTSVQSTDAGRICWNIVPYTATMPAVSDVV